MKGRKPRARPSRSRRESCAGETPEEIVRGTTVTGINLRAVALFLTLTARRRSRGGQGLCRLWRGAGRLCRRPWDRRSVGLGRHAGYQHDAGLLVKPRRRWPYWSVAGAGRWSDGRDSNPRPGRMATLLGALQRLRPLGTRRRSPAKPRDPRGMSMRALIPDRRPAAPVQARRRGRMGFRRFRWFGAEVAPKPRVGPSRPPCAR